ncbi:MAG: hypothetical protein J5687_00950 [Treponema sp.]|nr:hypothetical protein [Treponema sp.]
MIEDEELKAFFKFLISNKPGNEYTSTLKQYVEDAKKNMQWRHQYMTYLRQRAYDLEEGREQGRNEKAEEAAKNALALEIPADKVTKITGLSLEKVLELQEHIKVTAQA